MGLWNRINRAVRASINSFVAENEDPEKVLDQTVTEMQANLMQMRQAVAQAIATQKRTERQYQHHQTAAEEWYKRAQLALNSGDEAQAKSALRQRQTYLDTARTLGTHINEQRQVVEGLKQTMHALEVKIADARTRRDLYVARAQSAAASQRLHEMITQLNPGTGLGALDRMEDKVLSLEAQAAAQAELSQSIASNSLENRFAALENATGEAAVEAAFLELKGQGPGSGGRG